MKKKCLIIGPFPSPTTGLSLSNKVLYEGLSNLNFSVGKIDFSYLKFEETVGVFSWKKLIYFLRINFQFYKIFNYSTVILTIGQTFFGVLKYSFFIIFSKILKREVIIHLHGNMFGEIYKDLNITKKTIIRVILKMADKYIVLAPSHKNNFKPHITNDDIYVLPNFVEKEIRPNEDEFSVSNNNSLRIIYLSNLMTEKGIFILLEALRELKEIGINYEARIAGDIDSRIKNDIKNKINDLPNVKYIGIVKGIDKKNLLFWGNVFVFPSYLKEGFPLSILEAILFRNIIISTKHSSLTDFFKNNKILFIKSNSKSSLVEKLLQVNDNFDQFSESILKNAKYVNSNFTEEKFIENFINIVDA
jgi:glycosyltransferase involved in cell wall biosynthesis